MICNNIGKGWWYGILSKASRFADADLTQEELVKLLKMHKTTYTNYEQGKREPPFELIIKLAKFYDVSIDYIAGLSEDTSIKK